MSSLPTGASETLYACGSAARAAQHANSAHSSKNEVRVHLIIARLAGPSDFQDWLSAGAYKDCSGFGILDSR